MKKWEQLQLTLKSKSQVQGDYQDKTQKLFNTVRVQFMKYKSLIFLPWKRLMREFDLWNVFNEGIYGVRFSEFSIYQESTVFINLIFSLFVVISYGKNWLQKLLAVTYSGHLGDRYTGLGTQTLTPKKHFSSCFVLFAFQQIR